MAQAIMKKNNQQPTRVLLIEPNYKNKYPPLGLMKLATYHKKRGSFVRFYKGDLKNFVVDQYADRLVEIFFEIDAEVNWNEHKNTIVKFVKTGCKKSYGSLIRSTKIFGPSVGNWLQFFWKKYRTGKIDDVAKWDRICVSTLFTFYYKKTIETIEYCKTLLRTNGQLLVGGVMASVIPEEIKKSTGIEPIIGLLDKPGMLDKDDTLIIDELIPDYSILDEIDYNYPENNGYYGYMTRGCIRNCSFCAVPTIEPEFKNYVSLSNKISIIDSLYGERRNLLLLDNNVLASKKFPDIIKDIQSAGFYNDSVHRDPNLLELAIRNLKDGINDIAYRKKAFGILKDFYGKLTGKTQESYSKILIDNNVTWDYLPTPDQIYNVYDAVKSLYNERLSRLPKKRFVDFNQGVDARLLKEDKMALLSTIPIRPLRIAFDSMEQATPYQKAVRLAAKYNIQHLSNYLLFNYEEQPVELYQRLRMNIELSEELDIKIYSFPMRYSPIWDEHNYHHNRKYIGKFWNKKFIRAIQCILNATKGKVGRKKDFFIAAFGENEKEFFDILWMPEQYILHREKSIEKGYTQSWRSLFYSLSKFEYEEIYPILQSNDFINTKNLSSKKLELLLTHYQLNREDILDCSTKIKTLIKQTSQISSYMRQHG